MANANESALTEIVDRYNAASQLFDIGIEAVLNGGRMGDIEVIRTDNSELISSSTQLLKEIAQ
ncbi:MAG: hypothetical protein QNK24_01870 [Desulfuromusa sp.]|nr:hypothetical protein [Desulfuromusa sp.]